MTSGTCTVFCNENTSSNVYAVKLIGSNDQKNGHQYAPGKTIKVAVLVNKFALLNDTNVYITLSTQSLTS